MNTENLQNKLGYRFNTLDLLTEACRHSSFVNEHPDSAVRDNERLEFLGDAVLNLVIGHLLIRMNPDLPEGDLSRMRAGMVNELQLAEISRSLDLGNYLQLGKGEDQTQGRDKNSILADALEAVLAAVYMDGGFHSAFKCIQDLFSKQLADIQTPALYMDYKSRLQEYTQFNFKKTPIYKVIRETGPDHEKTFIVELAVGKKLHAEGSGKNKKLAEQDAAKKALEMMNVD